MKVVKEQKLMNKLEKCREQLIGAVDFLQQLINVKVDQAEREKTVKKTRRKRKE